MFWLGFGSALICFFMITLVSTIVGLVKNRKHLKDFNKDVDNDKR